MARSKFPGKPSKPVNRTRISVLPSSTEEGDTILHLPNNLKQDDEDEDTVVDTSFQRREDIKTSNTRRTIKRKRVCKRLIVRIPTINSQKFKNGNKETPHSKKKTDRRSDKEVSSGRKVVKVKQAHLEGNNVVGKFVLPSRSVHSSRVIKPNKRFINVDAVNNVRTFKKRVITKKAVIKVESNDFVNSSAVESDNKKSEETSIIRTPCSSRRVILRQARLQLHTHTSISSEGPFSSNSSNSSETVTCGVCGAVRFYRFVKQARKFNIYSCESCRKFISKMIKRQMCNKKFIEIQCLKGQGTCQVPPIVRSQHWKFRCSYKARCNACWLKMCLKAFQMPATLKNNLTNFLPKYMRESDNLFNNSLSLFSFHTNTSNSSIITPSSHSPSPNNSNLITKRRPIRKRVVKPNLPPISNIKRQKIDLKGPRVKHVCRSASIVLGQPLATFSEESKLECEINEIKKPIDSTSNTSFEVDSSDNKENNFPDNKSIDSKTNLLQEQESRNIGKIDILSKRDKTTKQHSTTVEVKSRKKREENCISTDFWENYDPEEVCRTGFGLISSVSFPMVSICFLCGSAGQDPLLFCCLCCEPYHPFCLEQIPQNITIYDNCYDWICPKCTVCSACGETDKQKFKCQKCNKAYHLECFNTKWQSNDRPTVCTSCLHCKSCGKDDIAKFIGNTPLCAMCFRLRKKGNFCPLCQGCYDDNDFDTKMMECGKCNKWVHAKCEGLSEEQYQILSMLPDSMEFLCNLCESTPAWKNAVVSELKYSCNMVLRLLSKNRIARNILKLSPICLSPRSSKNMTSARKLQFSDESEASGSENENDDETSGSIKKVKRKHNLKEIRVNLKPCIVEEMFVSEEQKVLGKVVNTLTLSDIKSKLNSNEYFSLRDFDENMKDTLKFAKSPELLEIYHSIIQKVFPWYNCDQNAGDNLNSSFCDVKKLEDAKSSFDCCKHKIVNNVENENRLCALCKGMGDGSCFEEARLLYCGNNEWIHANCALWSSEVYEEIDGALQNVQSAIIRGRSMRCSYCKLKGASIGCCAKSCHETYHFSCAQAVKCYFMHDKSIYCPSHSVINNVSVISSPSDFAINRSIYVELDKKKKKYVEPKQVQFIVGSLCITSLGTVVPSLSDEADAIIPLDLSCRRLFWSIAEPWKLVSYRITTHVLKAHSNYLPIDKNFTVDHTLPKSLLDKKLKEILLWQRDIEKNLSGNLESEDEEEPQIENAAADILSPELTDAILEELPHDLLDGISMQDIFPKLMSNEELLGVDFKIPDTSSTDLFNSKTENFQHLYSSHKISKIQNNQRSCSVKLSCKVDNTAKQVKSMSPDKSLFFQLLQVDGAYDNSSSSDCESIQEVDDLWIPDLSDEPVKCERCQCTYRTNASFKRHLDSCEVISTSESDSELMQEHEAPEPLHTQSITMDTSPIIETTNVAEPYMVSSFESYSSYQTTQNSLHSSTLNTQTFVNTEPVQTIPQNSELCFSNFQPVDSKSVPTMFTSSQTPTFTISQPSNSSQITIGAPQLLSLNQQSSGMPNELCVNQTQPLYISQPTCGSGGISIVQPSSIPISISQMNTAPMQMDIQPQITIQPMTQEMSPLLSQITLNTKMVSNQNVVNSMVLPQNQFMKPISKPTVIPHKNIRARGRPKQIAIKKTVPYSNKTFYLPPATVGGPSVVVQQLPSSNMIPTFLESFQQQTGQNLQYITTITPQITPTVTNQAPIMHLQPDGTLVNLMQGVQPTVILPQPRMVSDSILVDNNGSLMWAPQPVQPIYYGFETIVQNTVLQSQQILPGTVPGVLTANSSYSSTTQVFQTSKLEPILDVASGNIVLLNSSPVVNSQPLPVPQSMPNPLPTPPMVISENKPTISWNYIEPTPTSSVESQQKPVQIISSTPPSSSCNSSSTTSINLPIAPFIPEPGIPTNIVPPTPKPPMTSAFNSRPMNRVLPMPTINSKPVLKSLSKIAPAEKPVIAKKVIQQPEKLIKPKIQILEEIVVKPVIQPTLSSLPKEPIKEESIKEECIKEECMKEEPNPLKIVFQKQSDCGVYKISSTTKNISPVQVAPLKPIKTKCSIEPLTTTNEKLNVQGRKSSNKNESAIIYTIETQDGFHYSSNSVEDLWAKVFEAVQAARLNHNMPPLPSGSLNIMNRLQALGLKSNGLKYLLEQLPGAAKCTKYKPSFHFQTPDTDVEEDSEMVHHKGAFRCAPHINCHEPSDMFSWLSSKHRKPPRQIFNDTEQLTRRGSVTSLPMAMRFRHLKLTSKQSVGVYRSKIHKRGLFCHRDIESGEMVIEYAGEVIRSILADKREKQYTVKGMGCYMFRIDENFVVDATMKGNAARFINHSCEPNCYSKVVEILGHKHIIIFALRKIQCAEELTYDYKFPFEEDKIPCTCGSRRCRKFLN